MSIGLKIVCLGLTALLVLSSCSDDDDDTEGSELTTTPPGALEPGKSLTLDGDKNAEVKLNDKCAGVTLYQLDGDTLKQADIKTNDKGEVAGVFYISRAKVPADCKLLIGTKEHATVSSAAQNPAAGMFTFIGKWQRGNKGDELQVELGAKPSKAARLFLSVDGGAKWTEHKDLKWQEDEQANQSSLTYNKDNTAHNQVMLMVDGHWSFLAVPAVEAVNPHRAFKVSHIWTAEATQVKVDGIATEERVDCMTGLTALHLGNDGVRSLLTSGTSLTPAAKGELDFILVGTPNNECDYVLDIGAARVVLAITADSNVPSLDAVKIKGDASSRGIKVTLPSKPDDIDNDIVLHVASGDQWVQVNDTKTWTKNPITVDDVIYGANHVLLKTTKDKTDYWLYPAVTYE